MPVPGRRIREQGGSRGYDLPALGLVKIYKRQEEAEEAILEAAVRAQEIDIWAMRALGLLGLSGALLREPLAMTEQRIRVRLLLLHPSSKHIDNRAREVDESVTSFAKAVELGITKCQEWAQATHHNVSIWLYDALPVWRVLRFDDDLFVSSYVSGSEGHTSQMMHLTPAEDSTLHAAIKLQFASAMLGSEELDLRPINFQDRSPNDRG